MKTIDQPTLKRLVQALAAMLQKIGLGSKWAKVLAAMLVAGAVAWLGISVTGCTGGVTYEHPDYGRITFHGNRK